MNKLQVHNIATRPSSAAFAISELFYVEIFNRIVIKEFDGLLKFGRKIQD